MALKGMIWNLKEDVNTGTKMGNVTVLDSFGSNLEEAYDIL